MKFLIVALALMMVAASPGQLVGTMTLTNQPVYGGAATFHVTLDKKVQLVNSVVWCSQDTYIFMEEQFLPNNWIKGRWDGDITFGPLQTTGDRYGPWDSTKPALCSAVIFKDINNGQHGPVAITNWVNFTVPAAGP